VRRASALHPHEPLDLHLLSDLRVIRRNRFESDRFIPKAEESGPA
jgi:hypothetical protein